jgi:hypothetical protein
MSTQTRLTLSSVLVMTAIVAIISILDLGYQMEAQYRGDAGARRIAEAHGVQTRLSTR